MKKILLGFVTLLLLGVGLVVLIFFVLSLPKTRDVSNEPPFSNIVQKDLITKKQLLIVNDESIKQDKDYTYHLEDGSSYGMDSGLEVVATFPVETAVTIDKVELYTNRVSGTTTPYLFGKIYSKELQAYYTFQYAWGDYHIIYEDTPYWSFPLAFWQDEPLSETYIIDVP
ncbi:hypothetical protein BN863_16260 [Formosa agariphila KMM 3901]|uniref:Uncharacterized protein n=1 Tax=Formosa agariphila (strain DSM 15362 / KCTC 12365 / LMG 23005 / KMM 3901 / M-2Alg 35-1) TaxID=1347342 RepID=T2KLM1_FORAG|nr:hypothetical protein [Formosa agariphila]CDF79338.1 hypothetical protein BN863_16260 [Formosa agariphila KMM 3901]